MNISRQGRKVAWLSSALAGMALLLAYGSAQQLVQPARLGSIGVHLRVRNASIAI